MDRALIRAQASFRLITASAERLPCRQAFRLPGWAPRLRIWFGNSVIFTTDRPCTLYLHPPGYGDQVGRASAHVGPAGWNHLENRGAPEVPWYPFGTEPRVTLRHDTSRSRRGALPNLGFSGHEGTPKHPAVSPQSHFKTGALNHSTTRPTQHDQRVSICAVTPQGVGGQVTVSRHDQCLCPLAGPFA